MIADNAIGTAVTWRACIGLAETAGHGQAAWAPYAPNGTITTMQLATLPNLRVFLEKCIVHSRRDECNILEVTFFAKAVDLDHSLTAEQTNIFVGARLADREEKAAVQEQHCNERDVSKLEAHCG